MSTIRVAASNPCSPRLGRQRVSLLYEQYYSQGLQSRRLETTTVLLEWAAEHAEIIFKKNASKNLAVRDWDAKGLPTNGPLQ